MMPIVSANDFDWKSADRSIDVGTLATAQQIVDRVRSEGGTAVRELAIEFGDREQDDPLWYSRDELEVASRRIDPADLELLERVAVRIREFAQAQLDCLKELRFPVPGGFAGHTIEPIERVGCYAPAGRFPLPSTVLMTAVTASVAGCQNVLVASPNPGDMILAAAFVGGADRVLAVGGAQAIAAMAFGVDDQPACDLICGPGNRWVTAAKKIVNGDCGIDMLAGPSELVVMADDDSNPETVASDLLAQAEHDVDARPFVIVRSTEWADRLNQAIEFQLADLTTAEIARTSLAKCAIIVANSESQALETANRIAPEHLEIHCQNAEVIATGVKHAGCVFIGSQSAEVFGDYGVGPNHTLPTSGTARWSSGLNVFKFLRVRTWIQLDAAPIELIQDTARMAELEGLVGHQNAAMARAK